MAIRRKKREQRTSGLTFYRCLLCACVLLVAPAPAEAFEISGGVSMGGLVTGVHPRFAVSPHAAIAWRTGSGLLFAGHEVLSILPTTNPHGVGVYSQTAADLGYEWESAHLGLGPTLALYSMPACNPTV